MNNIVSSLLLLLLLLKDNPSFNEIYISAVAGQTVQPNGQKLFEKTEG